MKIQNIANAIKDRINDTMKVSKGIKNAQKIATPTPLSRLSQIIKYNTNAIITAMTTDMNRQVPLLIWLEEISSHSLIQLISPMKSFIGTPNKQPEMIATTK